jgi:hypothetical protein
MSVRRLSTLFALGMVALIGAAGAIYTRPSAAHSSADFAPPLSQTLARANVAAHNARAAAERAVAAQQIGAVDVSVLPNLRTVYFAETGHHLSNRTGFLDFWRANGQVLIFGYPISEEIVENGRIVQYFERARLEYNAEQGQVQIGRIGAELLQIQGMPPRIEDPQSDATYFPETGHTLSGEFQYYWNKRGGLAVFGYPLSEVVDEGGRQVQYFERAKMEYHPEDMASFFRSWESYNGFNLNTLFEVRLSDIGRQLAMQRKVNMVAVPQLPGTATWSPAIFARHIEVDLSRQWLTAYEGDLPVYSAPVATGRDGFNTPTGDYAIYYRLPMQTMVGEAGGESWNVPNVPWVQYVVGGVALHGTYWHDAHGTGVRMSHGCINLRIDDAQWLYEWADIGTTVSIHY